MALTLEFPMSRTALLAAREAAQNAVAALDAALAAIPAPEAPSAPEPQPLAWGAKVSPAFRQRVREIAAELGCAANDLMTCMAWESGRSFRADVKNMAGSGAVGLIQFMPDTAGGLGTSTEALSKMTPEAQLEWVAKYFEPRRGKLKSLGDLYMAILWPRAVGQADDYVLWDQRTRPTTYRQNAGLDVNKDGKITKREAAAKVAALLPEGLRPGNAA